MIDFSPTEWSKVLMAVMAKAGITDITITGDEIQEYRTQRGEWGILTLFEDNKLRVMTGPIEELASIAEFETAEPKVH